MSIPKGEKIILTRTANGKPEYIITLNKNMTAYNIYKIVNGQPTKIGQGKTPPDLEKKYIDK